MVPLRNNKYNHQLLQHYFDFVYLHFNKTHTYAINPTFATFIYILHVHEKDGLIKHWAGYTCDALISDSLILEILPSSSEMKRDTNQLD